MERTRGACRDTKGWDPKGPRRQDGLHGPPRPSDRRGRKAAGKSSEAKPPRGNGAPGRVRDLCRLHTLIGRGAPADPAGADLIGLVGPGENLSRESRPAVRGRCHPIERVRASSTSAMARDLGPIQGPLGLSDNGEEPRGGRKPHWHALYGRAACVRERDRSFSGGGAIPTVGLSSAALDRGQWRRRRTERQRVTEEGSK
jgi:hypothetical protein